jgi:hypothetical protein
MALGLTSGVSPPPRCGGWHGWAFPPPTAILCKTYFRFLLEVKTDQLVTQDTTWLSSCYKRG